MNNCDNCNDCSSFDGCGTPKIKFDLTDEAIEMIKEKADAAGVEFNAMIKQILIENMLENKVQFGFDGVDDVELKDYLEKSVHIDVVDKEIFNNYCMFNKHHIFLKNSGALAGLHYEILTGPKPSEAPSNAA